MLNNLWRERRKALFTENAEKMKRLLDNTQQKLDEVNTVIFPNAGARPPITQVYQRKGKQGNSN